MISISKIGLAEITPDLACRSGFEGLVDLLKTAKHAPGENVYLRSSTIGVTGAGTRHRRSGARDGLKTGGRLHSSLDFWHMAWTMRA